MKRFKVRVLTQGHVETMYVQAVQRDDVARRVVAQGAHTVLSIEASAEWRRWSRRFAVGPFLQDLIILLEAGLPVLECVAVLRDTANQSSTQSVLQDLTQQMMEGNTLSRAMQAQPQVFSGLLVATVASAERTGQLATALSRYRAYEARLENVRKTVVGALIYPLLVLCVGALVLLFMLFFVIPRFANLFDGMQTPSLSVQVMVWWGAVVQQHSLMLVLGVLALVVASTLLLRQARVRVALAAWFWRLPRLSGYRLHFVFARFYRSLGLLLEGGVTAYDALALIESLLPAMYRPALMQARIDLRSGVAISQALKRNGLTTAVSLRLLQISERSADLASMCSRIGQFYEDTVDRAIVWLSKVFEPLVMLGVGLLVGVIVFLLYTPVFELVGGVQGVG